MLGLIGKKIGMTSIFTPEGKQVACTVIETGPCSVSQIKNVEVDGYTAVQLGFEDKKEKHTSKPEKGHFAKAETTPKRKVFEMRDFSLEVKPGQVLTCAEIFTEGEKVEVTGWSKGKGFQGVVRRHGFAGVGGQTHGQHNRLRHAGSIGACSFPSRVFKGMRMAGRLGNDRVNVKNLEVLKVIPENNLVVVKGAVPGAKGGYLIVMK